MIERKAAYSRSRQPDRPSKVDSWADGFASPPCDGFALFETPQPGFPCIQPASSHLCQLAPMPEPIPPMGCCQMLVACTP